jgi:hypothetical protein
MRRLLLVMAVALVMAAMLAVMAAPALAVVPHPIGPPYEVCERLNDLGHHYPSHCFLI